jgi:hypothetical protein
MGRYLLGYDLRLGFADFCDGYWDDEKRAVFLLRPDIARPASVDPWIWPSVFRYLHLYQSPTVTPHQGAIAIEPTSFDHGVTCLWPNLEAMVACHAEHRGDVSVVPIAIILHGDDARVESDHSVAILDADRMRAAPPDGWTLLGFDAADQGLTSGLSNCGYSAAEKPEWQRRWAPRLNDHGLLTTIDDATAFAAACDARIPEHAPFFVYALYADPAALRAVPATA